MSMNVRKRKHVILFLTSIIVLCLCMTGCSAKPLPIEQDDGSVRPLLTKQADGTIIYVPATGNMTLVRYFDDPSTVPDTIIDTTNEDVPSIETNPSIDDERQILEILNGKKFERVSGGPACATDICIYSDNYRFLIHTACGSIIATIDDRTMHRVLSDDELEELLTFCNAS